MADNNLCAELPWNTPPLNEWSICGMNHYNFGGEKFIYVCMAKGHVCIKVEGRDNHEIWDELISKASPTKQKPLERRRGKKTVSLDLTEPLYLSVCVDGFYNYAVAVDNEILEMTQEVIQEYKHV